MNSMLLVCDLSYISRELFLPPVPTVPPGLRFWLENEIYSFMAGASEVPQARGVAKTVVWIIPQTL